MSAGRYLSGRESGKERLNKPASAQGRRRAGVRTDELDPFAGLAFFDESTLLCRFPSTRTDQSGSKIPISSTCERKRVPGRRSIFCLFGGKPAAGESSVDEMTPKVALALEQMIFGPFPENFIPMIQGNFIKGLPGDDALEVQLNFPR